MAANKAIVISTHILEEVQAVCTRAVIIAHGRLLADGTPDDLIRRDARHNAVVVKLPAAAAGKVSAGLAGLPGVAGVDAIGQTAGNTAAFRARALDGQSIVVQVGEFLRAHNISAEELYVEQGHMDEVFRAITTAGPAEVRNA